MHVRILAIALLVLNAYDLLVTRAILSMGGVESNPLLSPIVGSVWGIALKVGAVGVVVVLLGFYGKGRMVVVSLGVAVAIYVAVVLSNTYAWLTLL